jgi:excisionase family DNA binding protein
VTGYASVEGTADTMPPGDTLWTADDVARYCRVSRSMIYKQSQAGLLPTLRVGSAIRFDPDTVRRWARGEVVGLPEGRVLMMKRGVA